MPTLTQTFAALSLETLLTVTLRSFTRLYGSKSPQVQLVRTEIDKRLALTTMGA